MSHPQLTALKLSVKEIEKTGAPCALCDTHAWRVEIYLETGRAVIYTLCQPCSTKKDVDKLVTATILKKSGA